MKWNRRDMVCMSNSIRWFGWQLSRDRGFLVFYIVALFCLFPLLTFAIYSPEDDSFLYLELVILPILCIVAMACFMPSHLFAHLWNKRELDLYSSIPLKRAAMFSLRFFTGLFISFVPLLMAIALECGVLLLLRMDTNLMMAMLRCTGKSMALGALLYSLNVWIAVRCHNRLDTAVMTISYLAVPLIIIVGVYGLIANNINAILVCNEADIIASLITENVLVRWLINLFAPLISFAMILSEGMSVFAAESLSKIAVPPFIWIMWLLESAMLTALSHRAYVRAPHEESGQRTSHIMMYPFVIDALTLGLFVYAMDVDDSAFSRSIFIGAIFLFLLLSFIAQRKVRIRIRHVATLAVLGILTGLLQLAVVQTAGFGLVQENIPADAERYRLIVTMDQYEEGQTMTMTSVWIEAGNDDLIGLLRSFQDEVIEDAKENDPSAWDDGKPTMTIQFNYDSNGGSGTRSYFLFDANQEYLQKYRAVISQFSEDSRVTTEIISES